MSKKGETYSDKEAAEMPRVELVYKYRYEYTDGKTSHVWMNTITGQNEVYAKLVSGARPGMIFSFPTPREGSILLGFKRYVGRWENKEEVVQWEARDLEEKFKHDAFLNTKDQATRSPLKQAIAVIREAYQAQGSMQKRSRFLVWLVDQIS